MTGTIKDVKIRKADENVNYGKFSEPTINIYDNELNRKMADKFMQFAPKTTTEVDNNVEQGR